MGTDTIKLLAVLYAAWNLVTLGVMGFDKLKAKAGGRRVPEKTLLTLAFCLGGVGVLLGMRLFRHKTRHPKFTWGVPVSILVNVAIGAGAWRFLNIR